MDTVSVALMRDHLKAALMGIASVLALPALGATTSAVTAGFPTALQIVAVAPDSRPSSGERRWLIYLDGPIDAGATSRLVNLVLQQQILHAVVYLNSPGGSLVTAMQVGRVFREHGFQTRVGARTRDPARPGPGTCYSACPFVLAGGIRRGLEPGSRIGLHRAENRVPVRDEAHFQSAVATQAVEYLVEMGIRPELAAMMAGIPHDRIRELTFDEAVRLNLLNPGG